MQQTQHTDITVGFLSKFVYSWRLKSAGMLRHVDVSETCSVCIFKFNNMWPWRWEHCPPPKRRQSSINIHGETSLKTGLLTPSLWHSMFIRLTFTTRDSEVTVLYCGSRNIRQRWGRFNKSKKPPQNSRHRKSNMKQVTCWGSTNIRQHRTASVATTSWHTEIFQPWPTRLNHLI